MVDKRQNPFEPIRLIGTITEVDPTYAKANLPDAAKGEMQLVHGHKYAGVRVGDFVVIDSGEFATVGRIESVYLPERERFSVEPQLGKTKYSHPIGKIQLLSSLELKSGTIRGGIQSFPLLAVC